MKRYFYILVIGLLSINQASAQRTIIDFSPNWKFWLGDTSIAKEPGYSDDNWRTLNLPHDWSIEGEFSEKNPGTDRSGVSRDP